MSADAIRVLQATAWYPPYDTGRHGGLSRRPDRRAAGLGVESSVLVPRQAAAPDYLRARRDDGRDLSRQRASLPGRDCGRGRPHLQFAEFQARVAAHRGAIYHQHSWSRGCGPPPPARRARPGAQDRPDGARPRQHLPARHHASVRERPCDGRSRNACAAPAGRRGAACRAPRPAAVARLPLAFARRARRGRGGSATALAARALGAERRVQVGEWFASADRVVAVCQWLHDALAANGVPPGKLVLSRQGVAPDLPGVRGQVPLQHGGPTRPAEAALCRPLGSSERYRRHRPRHPRPALETGVQLTVHAVHGGADETAYERRIRKLANGDPRVTFAAPLARGEIPAALAKHDALVVPSLCLETGPLVVLEAQAVGLYVMGSRLGGIAELVEEGPGGELVEAGSVRAWTEAIARLAERHKKSALACRPREVRTMSTVAAEMAELYGSL